MSWYVGVDAGSNHAGLAAIHETGIVRHTLIEPKGDLPCRLVLLRRGARHFLSSLAEDGAWACVIERPNTRHGGVTLLAAYGVLMEAARSSLRCPVLDVASAAWKARSVGHGRATVGQVRARALELGYDGPSEDVCVAVCCADTARLLSEPVRGVA